MMDPCGFGEIVDDCCSKDSDGTNAKKLYLIGVPILEIIAIVFKMVNTCGNKKCKLAQANTQCVFAAVALLPAALALRFGVAKYSSNEHEYSKYRSTAAAIFILIIGEITKLATT